jgi:hypothetical protein
MVTIPVVVRWQLRIVICISQWWGCWASFLWAQWKRLLKSSAHVWIKGFCFCCHGVLRVLYAFWILILYQTCDLQIIFFHSVSGLFTLLTVSSAAQNLNFFLTANLFFVFCCLCLGVICKKSLWNPKAWSFSPAFSPEFYSFRSHNYIFDPFEFIFVYSVRSESKFILFHEAFLTAEKILFFPIEWSWKTCQESHARGLSLLFPGPYVCLYVTTGLLMGTVLGSKFRNQEVWIFRVPWNFIGMLDEVFQIVRILLGISLNLQMYNNIDNSSY